MSFDIEKIIYEPYKSHTKESKEQDIRFLSIEQCIFDESVVFEYIRKSDHKPHDNQKNTTSHGRRSFFVFMKFSEYFWLFSCDCCLTDSFSEFIFFQDTDIDRIEDPRDEKCDQRKHDDII